MSLVSCLAAMPADGVLADSPDPSEGADPALRLCEAVSDLELLRFEDAAGMGV